MRYLASAPVVALLLVVGVAAQPDDCGLPGIGVDHPPDPRYHDDREIAAELLRLQNTYPAIARRVELQSAYGAPRTHENRAIYALKISDHVALDEDEPAFLLVSNHHARELITPEIALDLAQRLTAGYGRDPQLTARVNGWEIWICPTFNPDGLAYVFSTDARWRKNRRRNGGGVFGVDLNRNYPVHYGRCGGSTDPRSETYQGPYAASEPETQAMIAFAAAERFSKVLDLHSYGRDVRKPYGCGLCLPPVLCSYYAGVQGTLSSLAGYARRNSCCGGGEFAYQVNRHGALAFLFETGTSFQPSYPTALAEAVRVRPAIDRCLDLPLALSGHVTNRLTREAVEANLSVAGIQYQHGEVRQGEPRYGRYHYWLPPGSYRLTFSAVGYLPKVVNVTVPASGGVTADVELDPAARIVPRGTGRVGTTLFLDLASPGDANQPYLAAAAFSTTPGQTVLGRVFPLAPDALFAASLSLPGIFRSFAGRLDASAAAAASVAIPPAPALAGLPVHFAFLTADTTPRVRSVSPPVKIVIQE